MHRYKRYMFPTYHERGASKPALYIKRYITQIDTPASLVGTDSLLQRLMIIDRVWTMTQYQLRSSNSHHYIYKEREMLGKIRTEMTKGLHSQNDKTLIWHMFDARSSALATGMSHTSATNVRIAR